MSENNEENNRKIIRDKKQEKMKNKKIIIKNKKIKNKVWKIENTWLKVNKK